MADRSRYFLRGQRNRGVMVSRRMIRSRLGWLNTVAEPQTEQKTKAAMEIEVDQEKHDEYQVQDKDDNQQNQELTEPPEVTRSTEKENVEKGRERKMCQESLLMSTSRK